MKIIKALIAAVPFAIMTGCAGFNVPQTVQALSTDPAAVHAAIVTPYGTITIDRLGGTNAVSSVGGPNGITTK